MEIPDIGLREMAQEMNDDIDELLLKYYKKGLKPDFLAGLIAINLVECVMATNQSRDKNFEILIKCMRNAFEKRKIETPLV